MTKEIFKRFLKFLTLMIVIIMSLPLNIYAEENSDIGLLGAGTEERPYEIYSYDDFQKINDNITAVYNLCADINVGQNGGVWESIYKFSGTFHGNGHVIYGIKDYVGKSEASPIGVFSSLDGASLDGLTVLLDVADDEYIQETYSGGIIVGTAKNSTISRCCAKGNVSSGVKWPTVGYGNYLGGIVGQISYSTRVDQCAFYGKLRADTKELVGTSSAGGIVGECSTRNGAGIITNCVSSGYMYSYMGYSYQSSGAYAGGIIGDCSSVKKIENCLSVCDCSVLVPYWGPNSGTFPTGSFCDPNKIGGVSGCSCSSIESSYYCLSVQTAELKGNKGKGLSDDLLGDVNSYLNWDFENIWAINPDINNGIPYLRNVNLGSYSEDTHVYRTFEYTSNILKNDIRVPIDKTIVLTYEQWANIENYQKIYVTDESGNKVNIFLKKDGCSIYILPSNVWSPDTKYTVVIPVGIFNIKDHDVFNSSSSFSFTTTYLSNSNEAYKVDTSYVTMKYPTKYVFWGQDKSVPAIPSNNDEEYVKEFRKWAKDFGYNSKVSKMPDAEIKKILNTEYGELLELCDHSIAKETGTNKTVKDCMRDIIMAQNMQEFLIKTEEDLKNNCDLEHMNESVQEFNKCYSRYLEYEGNRKTTYSSVRVMSSLLDYALLFDGLADGNQDDRYFYEFYNTRNESVITPSEFGNYLLNIMNVTVEYEDLSKKAGDSFNLNVTSEQLKNSRKALSITKKYGHLVWDIFDASTDTNVTDLVKEIVKDKIDLKKELAKLAGIGTSSTEYKCVTSSIEGLEKIGKYMAAGNSFLLGLDAIKLYYETATNYYNFITDQYPSWLFMNVYYMSNASPEVYESIWCNDDDFMLEYGQGAISSEDYFDETDPIVKLLKGALLDNGSMYNIYTYQDSYVRNHNIWGSIDVAQNLSEIRRTNINSCASVLMTYGLNEYSKSTSKITCCKVACPTDVQIIEEATGEVVQTISNNMEIENNIGKYGSYYLAGKNSDQKYVALNEGYTIKVLPTAKGKMDCEIYSAIGKNEIFRNIYDNLNINVGEEYLLDINEQDLYLIEEGNIKVVVPTNSQNDSNNNSKPNDDDSNNGPTRDRDNSVVTEENSESMEPSKSSNKKQTNTSIADDEDVTASDFADVPKVEKTNGDARNQKAKDKADGKVIIVLISCIGLVGTVGCVFYFRKKK